MKNFIHKFNIKYKKILDSSNVLFYSILGLYLTINLDYSRISRESG